MTHDPLTGREVIFEFQTLGNYVKVSAVDVKSMTEISVQGPISAGEKLLRQNALARLAYILRKKGILP